MLKNYLKVAIRNILKHRLFSFINILGLAIGMTSCLLILHYVNFEKSYDKFHEDSNNIYRLRCERTSEDGSVVRFASCCPPAAPHIRGRYPEVEKIGRIFRYQAVVSFGDIHFLEDRLYFAEPEFFEILKVRFIQGDPVNDIRGPSKAFISQGTARKYFGDQDPVGKTISVDKRIDYTIVGLFEDVPQNSHLKFDIILSFQNLHSLYGPDVLESWGHTGFFTYLRLRPDADIPAFKKKLVNLVEAEFGKILKQYNLHMELPLQPLREIHLTSHFMQEYEINGDLGSVNLLFIIALFIIVMAAVNYINLSTARSLDRAKEVGLRKVVGATRRQVMNQFFFETMIINILAILLTFVLLELSLPTFSQLTRTPLEYSIWETSWFWLAVAVMLLAGIFLSGFYPVIAMSSFEPITVLRGKLGQSPKGISLRKALVVIQFTLALFLITGTFTVYKQISYMRSQELGFDIEQILVVQAPRVRDQLYEEKLDAFKDTTLKSVDIAKITHVTEVPGRQIYWDAGGIHRVGEDIGKSKNYQIVGVDFDFVGVFDLKIIQGRNLSKEFPSDKDALILNETAVKWMGFESPEAAVGEQVNYWGDIFTVVGVVKDYHQQSLKEAFEPHILRYMPYGRGLRGYFALKIRLSDVKKTISWIKQHYDEFFPGNPFNYFFLDDYYHQQYQGDELFGKVTGIFSFLAILVMSLGIFGLSSFMTVQRMKEIGIRKVLGASVVQILLLLMRDLMTLVFISFVIAFPLSLLGVHQWLNAFAYRMSISYIIFLLPLFFVSAITLFTISSPVYKAGIVSPAEVIKYE